MQQFLFPLVAFLFLAAGAIDVRSQSLMRTPKVTIQLQSGWQFKEAGKQKLLPATVPGCVHTDLLNNGLIEDPFYRDNEKKLQWIDKADWEYQTNFDVTPQLLAKRNVELVFEGLDTYANVFLNGEPLFGADNMFRTWRIDCKDKLRPGSNTLLIRFRSPVNEILPLMAKMDYQLPSPNDQGEKTSPFTRKAPYQFGWDWGPRFVTSGIWKPVYLQAWDDARIADLHIVQNQVNSDSAKLTAAVEITSSDDVTATLIVMNSRNRKASIEKKVRLRPGSNEVSLDINIPSPRLWWPSGLGRQTMYTFDARLVIDGRMADQTSIRTGLRSLQLQQQRDKWGQSFEFVINGVPVFAKGGNWIPADSFPTRVSREKYRRLIESVRDTNMNMLRVWGGGIYESDDFYELCDELGILVWQDFMFACSMYPGNAEFLDSVRHEAIDNVKRLRNHPSIVIWAGNNEVETAWANWGWRQNLPATIWEDYKKIFLDVLPQVCATLDPSRPYWPSSPHGGLEDDPESKRSGDVHYWAVWHAAEPFTNYQKQFPRFMSEFGFQSFPQVETVNSYTLPSDRDIQSPVMLAHQRHPRGNQLIREYMLREYLEPKDFESFLYVSQVLQAEGIKIGAEHLRRLMPRNMGSLYWQINDCWPVASWSGIDYYGRWKALHFYARRFYGPVLVSPQVENGNMEIYVVSDRTNAVPAQLRLSLMDFEGKVLMNVIQDVTIDALSSRSYLKFSLDSLKSGRDPKQTMLILELVAGGATISTNQYFFDAFKNLTFPTPTITTDVTPTRGGFKIVLTSDKFARAVYLSAPNHDGVFTDNYFDLLPGRKVTIEYRKRTPISIDEMRNNLKVRSLVDAF